MTKLVAWLFGLVGVYPGNESPEDRFITYGISNIYFLTRIVGYLLILVIGMILFLAFRFVIWTFWVKDPMSPALSKMYRSVSSWAFWAFPMRLLYIGYFDLFLTALLNIRFYFFEDHVWSLYMEVSLVLSFAFVCLLPFCCVPWCLRLGTVK